MALRAVVGCVDNSMWGNQIQYFLTHDPRVFDFYAAYGHPGTTLVELGSLFHVLFGFSYSTALTLGVSVLIAGTTAACAVLCFLLYQQSRWWLATALVLLLNRMYLNATPPTAVVMPFIVLMVLFTWWLWQQTSSSKWLFFLWGVIAGLSAATRLDVSLLVGTPMILLIWYRRRGKAILQLIAGVGLSFFAADPFLWFMPIRHVTDLVHKFTIHYEHYSSTKIDPFDMINSSWLSVVSFCWGFILLCQKRLARIIPVPIMIVFSSTCFLSIIGILSSKFQSARYLYPLIIVWEVFLPLFALETLASYKDGGSILTLRQRTVLSSSIIVLIVLTQLLAYLIIFV